MSEVTNLYHLHDEFNRLIDERNDRLEQDIDADISDIDKRLIEIGAWIDSSECWRHPDDHDPRPLQEIFDEDDIEWNARRALDMFGPDFIDEDGNPGVELM